MTTTQSNPVTQPAPQPDSPTQLAPSKLPSYISADGSVNRKVAFASVGAAFGSIISLFLTTFLLSLPMVANMPEEDQGTLKASLTSGLTAITTLLIGYQTKPGARDQVVEKE